MRGCTWSSVESCGIAPVRPVHPRNDIGPQKISPYSERWFTRRFCQLSWRCPQAFLLVMLQIKAEMWKSLKTVAVSGSQWFPIGFPFINHRFWRACINWPRIEKGTKKDKPNSDQTLDTTDTLKPLNWKSLYIIKINQIQIMTNVGRFLFAVSSRILSAVGFWPFAVALNFSLRSCKQHRHNIRYPILGQTFLRFLRHCKNVYSKWLQGILEFEGMNVFLLGFQEPVRNLEVYRVYILGFEQAEEEWLHKGTESTPLDPHLFLVSGNVDASFFKSLVVVDVELCSWRKASHTVFTKTMAHAMQPESTSLHSESTTWPHQPMRFGPSKWRTDGFALQRNCLDRNHKKYKGHLSGTGSDHWSTKSPIIQQWWSMRQKHFLNKSRAGAYQISSLRQTCRHKKWQE